MEQRQEYFPKVSVLIPVYNVANYIEQCLTSVLNQAYPNLEIIIVDDCSPDQSLSLIHHLVETKNIHNHKIYIHQHQKNKGLAGARMTSFQHASGDYILFLDSDDYWFSSTDLVNKIVLHMEEAKADLLVFNYIDLYKKKSYKQYVEQVESPLEIIRLCLEAKYPAYLCNKCFRREDFARYANVWQEGFNMWEDLQNFIPYVLNAKKVIYLEDYILNYRRFNENAITLDFSSKNIASMFEVHKFVQSLLAKQLSPQDYSSLETALRKNYLTPALTLLCSAKYKVMRETLDRYPQLHEHVQGIGGVGGIILRTSLFFARCRMPYVAYLLLRLKSFLQTLK